jgi:hypothetical protein
MAAWRAAPARGPLAALGRRRLAAIGAAYAAILLLHETRGPRRRGRGVSD